MNLFGRLFYSNIRPGHHQFNIRKWTAIGSLTGGGGGRFRQPFQQSFTQLVYSNMHDATSKGATTTTTDGWVKGQGGGGGGSPGAKRIWGAGSNGCCLKGLCLGHIEPCN